MKRFTAPLMALLSALTSFAAAGPFDPPPTYYNTATGTGATLHSQLHNIIDNHTVYSYGDARTILQDTDVDPNDPDNIILVYNRVSLDISGLGGSIPGWDSGVSWNREHTWPRSRGVGTSGPDNSDLHQLRPSNPSVNSSRGNLNFGGAFGQQPFGSVSDGGTVWYPGDEDAGMIARQQFYMDVRYDGSDSNTEDLVLLPGNPSSSGPNLGNLNRLIEFHYAAVPDFFELRRNDVIYDSYQGNRNPFVDRPEFVWSVFVDQNNDSQIVIDGGSDLGNGATSTTIDYGRVIVGSAVPAAQTVNLSKNGLDGTYYEVTIGGDASSTVEGRYNAFLTGTTDSSSLDVGLSTTTATAGNRSGTVTIDNLDITTGLGAGFGDGDGNDVVNVTLDVVDHAEPSFANGVSQTSLTLDFGIVAPNLAATPMGFDIFNLEATAGFTADLDLDSILGSGDTTELTTDLTTFSGLAAGPVGNSYAASVDTSTSGVFAASYTLSFSDEDIDGAISLGNLILDVDAIVTIPGDVNLDGTVNGLDANIVSNNFLTSGGYAQGDVTGDGLVNGLDANIVSNNFTSTVFSTAIPEPSTLALVVLAAFCCGGMRHRRPEI